MPDHAQFAKPAVVTSLTGAILQVRLYQKEVEINPKLRDRIPQHHHWYAVKEKDGSWIIAPSKFVGYAFTDAQHYLEQTGSEGSTTGGDAETALKRWRQKPPPWLIGELQAELEAFVQRLKAKPRGGKGAMIWLLPDEAGDYRLALGPKTSSQTRARIVADPDVCHGRPRIKGTRIRVSDILDLLAEGATTSEILADFPSLDEEDVRAALAYAAQSLDHRVVRSAA